MSSRKREGFYIDYYKILNIHTAAVLIDKIHAAD